MYTVCVTWYAAHQEFHWALNVWELNKPRPNYRLTKAAFVILWTCMTHSVLSFLVYHPQHLSTRLGHTEPWLRVSVTQICTLDRRLWELLLSVFIWVHLCHANTPPLCISLHRLSRQLFCRHGSVCLDVDKNSKYKLVLKMCRACRLQN